MEIQPDLLIFLPVPNFSDHFLVKMERQGVLGVFDGLTISSVLNEIEN